MNQVDRYMLRHFLRILALSLATCIGIYLLVDFLEKIGDFIKYKSTLQEYLSYFNNSVLVIALQVIPLAILMSMVLTLGSLGRSNEITAMRACGLSIWRIIRPLTLAVIIISGGYLMVNELLAPASTRQLTRITQYKLKGRPVPSMNSDRIWYRDGNRIIRVALARPEKGRLQGVTIFTLDDNFQLKKRLQIPELHYSGNSWQATQVRRYTFEPRSGDLIDASGLSDQTLDIGRTPTDFVQAAELRGLKNVRELWQTINKLREEGFDTTRFEVDLHTRLAAPLTCLVMAFLGVPFSLGHGRGSSAALGIGLSLGIGVAYFLIFSVSLAFGYSGALPPFVAGWAANSLFLLGGIYLMMRMRE